MLTLHPTSWDADKLEPGLRDNGWVCGPRLVDKDGKEHVNTACSKRCYNRRVRDLFERHESRVRWWKHTRGFEGEPPVCTCTLTEDNGLLIEKRDPTCQWHAWAEQWRRDSNERQERLFEKWRDVPVGTLVYEEHNVSRGRGQGRTAGPAKIVEWTFGGYKSAMVPVEGWRPYPRLQDLTIVEE